MIKKVTTGKKAGKYAIRIQPRDKITGKRINFSIQYANTKAQALKIEAQMWQEYESGITIGRGTNVFADDFQKYIEQRSKSISPVTYKAWQESARSFKAYFGKTKINQITQAVVSRYAHDYVDTRNASVSNSSTIAKRLAHMRTFFKTIEGKSIQENPVPISPLKVFFRQSDFKLPDEWHIFSDDELERIRNFLTSEVREGSIMGSGSKLAVLIASYTGMRVGELQALKFENIIQDNGVYTFKINDSWSDLAGSFNGNLKARPRGTYRLVLPVPASLIETINIYKKKQDDFLTVHGLKNPLDIIFLNLHDYKSASNSEPIKQKSMNEMLRVVCKKLKIDSGGKRMSLYAFRHTICTHLANTPGMSYPWACERMGHSLNMFMKRYVGIDRDVNKRMIDLINGYGT